MRLITEVLWGKRRGTRRVLAPQERVIIGSSERAQLVLAHDKKLAGRHLQLSWDGEQCRLESKRGVLLAGEQTHDAEVPHGSWIRAGETDLLVSYEGASSVYDEDGVAGMGEQRDAALTILRGLVGELYAVVDASRESQVLAMLRESVDPRSCLYEGEQAVAMYDVAPYLVKFGGDSALLERLVRLGWGKRWACFFCSGKRFKEVRTHLRRFLLVSEETSGEELYFRFYDPDVMRAFLGMITPRQHAQLFGKVVSEILMEEPPTERSGFAKQPAGSLVRVARS